MIHLSRAPLQVCHLKVLKSVVILTSQVRELQCFLLNNHVFLNHNWIFDAYNLMKNLTTSPVGRSLV